MLILKSFKNDSIWILDSYGGVAFQGCFQESYAAFYRGAQWDDDQPPELDRCCQILRDSAQAGARQNPATSEEVLLQGVSL